MKAMIYYIRTYISYTFLWYRYVRIYRSPGDEGCYATLGFVSNSFVHVLHLGPDCCFKEVVIHELLHNLGAHHEQTRPDR